MAPRTSGNPPLILSYLGVRGLGVAPALCPAGVTRLLDMDCGVLEAWAW